jgi:Tol biopolymer transport system component
MRSTNRVFRLSVALIFSVFSLITSAATADAFAGQTTRVSVSSDGVIADNSASSGVLSGDGNYVVFMSAATNLVPGAAGLNVYRHDRTTLETVLVSVAMNGIDPGNNVSKDPSVSYNGRFVVFDSFATNLVADDTNGRQDVFVRDMVDGTTRLVSGATAGVVGMPGNSFLSGLSGAHEISDDGNYIVFMSFAQNLVAGATNGTQQVYWKAMDTGVVVRVSVNAAGQFGDRPSEKPAISGNGLVVAFESSSTNFSSSANTAQVFTRQMPDGQLTLETEGARAIGRRAGVPTLSFDGRYLAFESEAPLDPADLDNGTLDIFLRDRTTGTTELASRSLNSVFGATSARPSISSDGRWVSFDSLDELLVVGDVGGMADVFVYDRVDKTVTLVSRNDAGEQANAPSGLLLGGPSLSSDGNVVLFGSTASNLVAEESNIFNQLYVRKLVDDTPQPPQVTFAWLAPLSDTFSVGRNLPVKFTVHSLDGVPVLDTSVQVDVVDLSDAVVAGPYFFGTSPSRSVTWSSDSYHVNVDTRTLEPGMYRLRVQFSSPTLTAEFSLATNGTASALRSRLRD